MGINWSNATVKLGDLKPWSNNPRTMTKRQAQRLLKSWGTLGQFQTIAIGPSGEVYDGHQRLSALLAAHGPQYAIEARQSDRPLDDAERSALTIAANVPAGNWNWDALAGWDAAQLQEWGMDAETLKAWNSDAAALAMMLEVPPDFSPVGIDEQGRLDQKSPIICPLCGGEFVPE